MITHRIYAILKANMVIVVPSILVILIIIFGGIGVYLAEHEHQGANITNLGNAFWWAVGNNHNSRIWRLHSGYDNWTDNCDIRDVRGNWYRCGSFRYTFPREDCSRVG